MIEPLKRASKKRFAASASLLLAAVLTGACGNVKKRTDVDTSNGGEPALPDDDGSTPEATTCGQYCDEVMQACVQENAVYATVEVCLAVCAQLEPGDPLEPTGNTLACRAARAKAAKTEPDTQCWRAGPGGGGTCGSDCEAYCALYPLVCPDEASAQGTDDCLERCGELSDQSRFNVTADHGGDTLECRLVHLSSATLEPAVHCAHARLEATEPWCVGAP
jgi:hypothetical protein